MKAVARFFVILVFLFSTAHTVVAQAQLFPSPDVQNPATASANAFYSLGKRNILEGAEKMPAEYYTYQPTKDVRTFAQIVAHIADTQYIFCSAARNIPNPNGENLKPGQVTNTLERTLSTKAELTAALRRSFEFCDPAFATEVSDAAWKDTVTLNNSSRPRATPMLLELIHMWEHYGNMTTYMREKNVVPPSTERVQQQQRRP